VKVITELVREDEAARYLRKYSLHWFRRRYRSFTPAQAMAIPQIKKGHNVLISSPTGSGKTLAAFLAIIDELYGMYESGELDEAIYVVYVSPLRALNNDMRKNLIEPIKGIREVAEELGIELPEIKVAVRTSDTSSYEKQKMVRNPPHILITTPESLSIALTAPKFRERLRTVRWVIVDEIHELANSKRGAHLSLSLERLEELTERELQRIGLSATIAPLDEVGRFLVGFKGDGTPRDCVIIDARFFKPMEVKVIAPKVDIIRAPADVLNNAIYKTLEKIVKKHRTTLVFTNTRSATERVVYKLKKIFEKNGIVDADQIEAHHSSLSRNVRLEVENKLKEGKLRAVVCVSPDTSIYTNEGIKKVASLKGGEEILGVLDFRVVANKYREPHEINYDADGLSLRTALGFEVKVTKDHKFLTIDGGGNLVWVRAKDLRVGDYVGVVRRVRFKERSISILDLLPDNTYLELSEDFLSTLRATVRRKKEEIEDLISSYGYSKYYLPKLLRGVYPIRLSLLRSLLRILNLEINEDCIKAIRSSKRRHYIKVRKFTPFMSRLLGFWLADGSWKNSGLTFFSSDKKMLRRYAEAIEKEIGIKSRIRKQNESTYSLEIYSTLLLGMFKNLIRTSRKKSAEGSFPAIVYQLPEEHRREFLSGYFDGYGFLEIRNGRIYSAVIITSNKNYAEGIRTLLLSFGIVASIRKQRLRGRQLFRGRVIEKKGIVYSVAILGGEYLRKFLNLIRTWRTDLPLVNRPVRGYTNADVIPNLSRKLRNIRTKLGISTYSLQIKRAYNPEKVELGERRIRRDNLRKLLNYYLKLAEESGNSELVHEIEELLNLANGDIFFDKIVEIKKVRLGRAYGIIDSESGNYVVNGFISKNSSTSLELGIDIGYIDAVVLLSSPKSVTRLIQRVGRSGHKVYDTSRGYLIVVDRDDLVECSVLGKLAMERKLDRVRIPRKPLDILAQHVVGMSLEKKWRVEEAYKVVKRSYNYSDMSFKEFLNVLRYLAGRYGRDLESVNVYSKLWFDELEGTFGRKRSARMIYFLNSGAIPDEAKVHVFLENGRYVGDLEEAFVEYLEPGDVFVLGGRTYEFIKSDGYRVFVRRVEHQRPTVPSWFSEMLPLSFDSALEVGKFRRKVHELIVSAGIRKAIKFLVKEYGLEPHAAKYVVEYIKEQAEYTGGLIPSDRLILVEIWRDPDSRTTNIIFHTLLGRRANDALSRAYAYVLGKLVSYTVRVTVTDNGFMLTLPSSIGVSHEVISKLLSMVRSSNLRLILRQALRRSEILKRRFRHCAERAFAILRRYKGVETSISRRQVNSETLLRIAERLDNFPVLEEAYREVMEDYMNVEDAEKVLKWIEDGVVEIRVFEAPGIPSPFSHNIVAHGYSDIVLMEDRRKLLLKLYEAVLRRMQ